MTNPPASHVGLGFPGFNDGDWRFPWKAGIGEIRGDDSLQSLGWLESEAMRGSMPRVKYAPMGGVGEGKGRVDELGANDASCAANSGRSCRKYRRTRSVRKQPGWLPLASFETGSV